VEKFEVLVAAWQVHATAWSFTGTQRKTNQLKQARGRADACILRLRHSFARDEPLRASFLSAPLSARDSRRVGKQESGLLRILETEDLREKTREVAARP